MKIAIVCAHCGGSAMKEAGHVKRSRDRGDYLYCDRACSGLGRRKGKTKTQLIAEKKAYDAEYRKRNIAMLKAKKRAYFERTYDPAKAAVERKRTMPRHVEYCRQPAYRRKKQAYDRVRRAAEYGEFAEAYMLSIDLNRTIKGSMTNAEIKYANETCNKTQHREREAKQEARERNRPRERRAGHSAADGH